MQRRWILGLAAVAVLGLLGAGLLDVPAGAAPGQPGAPRPADVTYPAQEGFESGTLPESVFEAGAPVCPPHGCGWAVVSTDKHTGAYAAFAPDLSGVSDQLLTLSNPIAIPASAYAVTLSFWQRYAFEATGTHYYDGGVLEASSDGGASWSGNGIAFVQGGYTATIETGFQNPLAGRLAWGGTTNGQFVAVRANLIAFVGQSIRLRFREGTDSSGSAAGWWVDDVQLAISAPAPCTAPAWGLQAPYPTPVMGAAVVALNGRLYAFGGIADGHPLSTAAVYAPETDSWHAIAPLPAPRGYASAVTYYGDIWILGGIDDQGVPSGSMFDYAPAQDLYFTPPSFTHATSQPAAAVLDGKIYRIGGRDASNAPTNSVEVYSTQHLTWSSVANYPQPLADVNTLAYGSYLYAAGGSGASGNTAKAYRYDPSTDIWDDAAMADLPAERGAAAAGLVNGRWVLAGGQGPGGAALSALAWDPGANTWWTLPSPGQPVYYAGGAAVGNALYLVGGLDSTQHPSTLTQRYLAVTCATFTPTPHAPSPTPGSSVTPASPTPVASATPGGPSPTPCSGFSDVHPADYFATPVQYLVAHGVISGYGDCTFRPYSQTTRSQMVKIVILGFQKPISTPAAGAHTFADVPAAFPFFGVIETAAAATIVSGYSCGGPGEPCDGQHRPFFRPYADVTRGQLAKIVVAAAGWAVQHPAAGTFADVAPGSPFYPFVQTASCHGIISGYVCGGPAEPCNGQNQPYFRPAANSTRGQIAKIVYGALTGGATCGPAR